MKTSYISRAGGLTAAIIMAAAAFPAAGTFAQTAGVPQGYSVMPVQDYDRSNDEIVQLNNLIIQGISGSTLYASAPGGICQRFYSTQGYGTSMPCPAIAPTVLYQVSIGSDAILLLKNRQRASMADFAVGDHINVFGFLDINSQFMQALIVRDLDKPSPQYGSGYYTQFNNVTAVTAPGALLPQVPGGVTASFDVTFSPIPCALYSGPTGYRLPAICPYVPTTPDGGRPNTLMLAKHTVNILSGQTVILNTNRQAIPISAIQAGDTLNIFGRYNPQTGSIDALIIRDLSSGTIIPNGSGTLRVTVTDNRIRCIQAPCGLVPNATVQAQALFGDPAMAAFNGVTDLNGQVTFPNIPAGTYSVTVLNMNAKPATVTVGGNKVTDVNISVNGDAAGPAPVISGVSGPTSLGAGETGTWRITASDPSAGILAYGVTWGDEPVYAVGQRTAASLPLQQQSATFTHVYNTAGTYNPVFTVTNGSGRSAQASLSVTVGSGGSSGQIRVISPNGGETLQRGSLYTIRWSVPPLPSGTVSSGGSYDIYAVKKTIQGDFVANLQYTLAKSVFLDFGITSGTYVWNVGDNREGMSMPDGGDYYIRVCGAGGYACDESDGAFTIGTGTQQGVQISSLSPTAGYAGTWITVYGTGFTPQDNIIHFNGVSSGYSAYLPAISSNGSSLTFQAPSETSYSCFYGTYRCMIASVPLPPGAYQVLVENANGTSNPLNFTLYAQY